MKFRVMITAVISLALTGETIAKPVLANVTKKPIPAKTVVKPPIVDNMPIRIGMTFAEIRAATPAVAWKMTTIENYDGRSFVRVLAAPAVAALDGLPLDVMAVRGPSDTLFAQFAQHFVSRPIVMNKGDCFARFRRFSDAVGRQTGVDVKAWLPEIRSEYSDNTSSGNFTEPRSDKLADLLIMSPQQSGSDFVPLWPIFSPRPWDYREPAISVPGYPHLSMSVVDLEKERGLGWYGHFVQANVRWMVTGTFEPDQSPSDANWVSFDSLAETPGKCRMNIVSKTGNQLENDAPDNDQSTSPYPLYTRDQLRDGGRLADRYYALLSRDINTRNDDEAGTYLCSLSLSDGGLKRCEAETSSPKPRKKQFAPLNAPDFLAGFTALGAPISEDDFALRFVRVKFAFRPGDKLPEFDWNKAEMRPRVGVQLTRDLQVSFDDFPAEAKRDEIGADVAVDCLVLPDFSVYCGRVTAQAISKSLGREFTQKYDKIFVDAVFRVIIRRMRGANAYPHRGSGSDPRGTYFRRRIKFTSPK